MQITGEVEATGCKTLRWRGLRQIKSSLSTQSRMMTMLQISMAIVDEAASSVRTVAVETGAVDLRIESRSIMLCSWLMTVTIDSLTHHLDRSQRMEAKVTLAIKSDLRQHSSIKQTLVPRDTHFMSQVLMRTSMTLD